MTVYINGVPSAVTYRTRVKSCFKCGEEGHVRSNCPDNKDEAERKCWNCGEEGHIRRNCPQLLPEKDEGLNGNDPVLPSAGSKSPFLPGVRPEELDESRKTDASDVVHEAPSITSSDQVVVQNGNHLITNFHSMKKKIKKVDGGSFDKQIFIFIF